MSDEPKPVIGYGPDAPTPWRVAGEHEIVNLRLFSHEVDPPDMGGIVDANGCEVIGSSEFLHGHEFLPRIVACVNFCNGEPTEHLSADGLGLLVKTVDALRIERDDLADALRSVVLAAQRRTGYTLLELADNATLALAKVRP